MESRCRFLALSPLLRCLVVRRLLSVLLIFLVAAAEFGSWRTLKASNQSTVDHWAKTGLSWADLYPHFSNESCNIDSRSQLSCLVGLDYIARQVSLKIYFNKGLGLQPLAMDAELRTPRTQQVAWEAQLGARRTFLSFSSLTDKLRRQVQGGQREAAIVAAGLNGQLAIRFDPHTYLIPISQFEENLGDQVTQEIGVGIQLKRASRAIIISKVFSNSRAEAVGLRRGDRLLAIDGQHTSPRSLDVARARLKGKPGSLVSLRIARGNQDLEISLHREKLIVNPVEAKIIKENNSLFGVLVLNKFSAGSCILVRNALVSLQEANVRGIVLDLRENGGGQLDEAGCVAEIFLPKNSLVFSTEYFEGMRQERFYTRVEPTYTGPLATLINANTASAAEILAGSFQDHGRSLIVGERSFGKGSFQSGRIWEQNSKVAYFKTQGLYYLPSGRSTQNIGIFPDIEIVGPGPQAQREADLFNSVNELAKAERLEWGTMLAATCQSMVIDASLSSTFTADRQMGKAYKALDCLRGIYGTKGD